ncbi:hypothetical protein EV421DRAFT_1718226, partial [Armillaria borealis]
DDSDSSGSPACSKEPRTELSIIWSCVATIFTSTWLAVHPNVPRLNLTKEGSVWRIFDRPAIMCSIERVKLMLVAILAPEVMVGWAIRQFVIAKKVWSTVFFVSMGGFYYGKEERLVTLKDVPKLLESLAKVRAVDIKDKSKGDGLSKMIVVLQISWFVVQCCARAARKLPITLLEMSTLAFAVLSIVSYAAWWEKPVNVLYHIRLEEKSSMDTDQDGCMPPTVTIPLDVDSEPMTALSPARRSLDNPDKSPGVNTANSVDLLPLPNTASFGPTANYRNGWPNTSLAIDTSALKDTTFPPGPEVYAESSLPAFIEDYFKTAERWGKRAMRPFTRIYFSVMGFIFRDDIGSGVDRPVLTAATGAAGMSCCDGGTSTEADDFSVRLATVLYVGFFFGAIHCAAWSFSFPSYAERVLWRTSSLAIIIGLLCGIGHILLPKRLTIPLIGSLLQRARKDFVSVSLSVLAVVIYIIARVTLIVLALLQLRSLPPLTLCTVNWTTFIPHI